MPGPHDFAVRNNTARPARRFTAHELPRPAISLCARCALASTAFRPNVRDDAYAPLIGPGCEEETIDLGRGRSELFFRGGLDDPNHVESAREIAVYARAIFQATGHSRGATPARIRLILPVGQINAASPIQ